MALTLDDLNDDVLYVLLQWLFTMANPADPAHARMTRTGLASVNKHFRSLALPKLFRSVKLRLSVDGEGQHETTAWEHSELRALVRYVHYWQSVKSREAKLKHKQYSGLDGGGSLRPSHEATHRLPPIRSGTGTLLASNYR